MVEKDYLEFIIKVHSIAKIGLLFSKDPYAIENYQELNDLSASMLKEFSGIHFDRPNYFERDIYPTPNISVRTLIFNDNNEVLMVRESNTDLWSLPGGWCDLYDSPTEAAKKEVSQEAGVECDVIRLIGVINRRSSTTNLAEYVIVFEGKMNGLFHGHTHETNDVRFFSLNQLPDISRKVLPSDFARILKAGIEKTTLFD